VYTPQLGRVVHQLDGADPEVAVLLGFINEPARKAEGNGRGQPSFRVTTVDGWSDHLYRLLVYYVLYSGCGEGPVGLVVQPTTAWPQHREKNHIK
jgi:hypothetical protein